MGLLPGILAAALVFAPQPDTTEWLIEINNYDLVELVEYESPYRGMGTQVDQWLPLVAGHFGDLGPEAVNRVMCLMVYESGGNPNAKNPTSSARGLMQVLASLWAPHFGLTYDQLYDPSINLWAARKIYDAQGWYAWSPYNRGLCR